MLPRQPSTGAQVVTSIDVHAEGEAGRILIGSHTTVGGREAVVPSIEGRAWITGHTQHVLHADDPFPTGLTVGDVWSTVRD